MDRYHDCRVLYGNSIALLRLRLTERCGVLGFLSTHLNRDLLLRCIDQGPDKRRIPQLSCCRFVKFQHVPHDGKNRVALSNLNIDYFESFQNVWHFHVLSFFFLAFLDQLHHLPSGAAIAKILTLRQQLAKSSVKKYQAMQDTVCRDARARGMFQFYGANRSGRWAGRHIQLQNLPQNHLPDLDQVRELVRTSDYESLELLYDNIPDTLSQLIRTAFIAKPGYKFVVSDFSAIEARVLSYLAGEKWRIDVFANNGDIYCASASAMFHVPVVKHGINGHLRQKGKIAELALGYGGSVGALKSMGALDMGLKEEELQPLVDMWRQSNPNIVKFWWAIDKAVKTTIRKRSHAEVGSLHFLYQSGMLFIRLPSGRSLSYVKPRIGENRFGGEAVTYMGIGATKKWERIESYGPKFVENIVQAISRDILCYAMRTLSHCFICGHVHDELIIECSQNVDYAEICRQMSRTPPWISGLLLRADGYETPYYKKD